MKGHQLAIKKIFRKNRGFASTGEMLSTGVQSREIKKLRDSGWMIRIKPGLYSQAGNHFSNESFVYASKVMPKGVIFLASALSHYGLTTFAPSIISMAIPRGTRRPKSEYPPVEFYVLSKKMYELGIVEIDIDGHKVKIYDIEKTVCDCFRYRNKIGINIAKEALSGYLKRKDRNLEKLLSYAEVCRAKPIMQTWLQAMI